MTTNARTGVLAFAVVGGLFLCIAAIILLARSNSNVSNSANASKEVSQSQPKVITANGVKGVQPAVFKSLTPEQRIEWEKMRRRGIRLRDINEALFANSTDEKMPEGDPPYYVAGYIGQAGKWGAYSINPQRIEIGWGNSNWIPYRDRNDTPNQVRRDAAFSNQEMWERLLRESEAKS